MSETIYRKKSEEDQEHLQIGDTTFKEDRMEYLLPDFMRM